MAVAVLAVGTLVLSKTLMASASLSLTVRERATATEAARRVLEELQDQPFSEVLALYTGANANFAVDGLAPQESDGDGMVGEIVFPVEDGELREDLDLPKLGTPLDLDGLGGIDGADHAADYRLLPVLVRVAWRGGDGPMLVELRTILAQR